MDLAGGSVKKILQLCTYVPEERDAGGKMRAFEIKRALRRRYEVETLSFTWSPGVSKDKMNYVLDFQRFSSIGGNHIIGDLGISHYLSHDQETWSRIKNDVNSFAPDAVLLEQPYLYPVFAALKEQGIIRNLPLIYSSHNIELPMKRKIFEGLFKPGTYDPLLRGIHDLETRSIRESSLVFAVSPGDKSHIDGLRGKQDTLVLPNGHWPPTRNGRFQFWERLLGDSNITNWFFVGSAHPPNISGLNVLFSALPEKKSHWRIIVAGSVANALGDWVNRVEWLTAIKNPSNEDIDSILLQCSGVILPIWGGGGSNLKTAQALLSGRPIIGTQYAFRGFESHSGGDEIHIRETPEEFAETLMNHKPGCVSPRPGVEHLMWDHILKDVTARIEETI